MILQTGENIHNNFTRCAVGFLQNMRLIFD